MVAYTTACACDPLWWLNKARLEVAVVNPSVEAPGGILVKQIGYRSSKGLLNKRSVDG